MADGVRGAQSLFVRLTAERIVRELEPKDKLSQLAAIYNWFDANYRYLHDPKPTELVKDPVAVLEEIRDQGHVLGDCDDAATTITGLARAVGIDAKPIRVSFRSKDEPFTHVLVMARDQYGRVVALDPVAGEKTGKMLRQAKQAG